jgi:four helix bundle protein
MQNPGDENFDLRVRTKRFGLRVIRLSSSLPDDLESQVIRRQVVRSGTSVGAQYREACRPRSGAEFRSKMNSALQELDETQYWFELLMESGRVSAVKMAALIQEVNELIAIFVSSIKTSEDNDSD